jgi:hypothetical protein
MDKVLVIGAARNAATRHIRRTRPGRKTRRVRIGGVHVVRPNRSTPLTMAQVSQYAEELRGYEADGLILLQDGSGRTLKLDELLGAAPVTKQAAPPPPPDTTPLADEPVEVTPDPEPEEEAEEEAEEEEAMVPYSDWDYADLKAEVRRRNLETDSQRKDDLVAALELDDDEE